MCSTKSSSRENCGSYSRRFIRMYFDHAHMACLWYPCTAWTRTVVKKSAQEEDTPTEHPNTPFIDQKGGSFEIFERHGVDP